MLYMDMWETGPQFSLAVCWVGCRCHQHYQFSNHPGYGSLSGTASPPEAIQDIILGLKQILDFNNVYDIILTGYTPNAEVLQILKSEIEQAITNSRNKPHWIVDPVLGDNGKLYVKET